MDAENEATSVLDESMEKGVIMPLLDIEAKPISNPEGTLQTLIHDPKVHQQIHLDKQAKVLQWLKTEIYSSGSLLGRVMGVHSRQAIHKALSRMQDDGLIRAGFFRFFISGGYTIPDQSG